MPKSKRKSRIVAIDEFPQFVTSTIAASLDELRKFGVRMLLAHQHLSQLTLELRGAVMGDAKMKVVLGGLSREDAEVIARELFSGEVRGDRIKYQNVQTKFRPHLEEREIETYSDNTSYCGSESEGWATGSSFGSGDSFGSSTAQRLTDDGTDETFTNAFSMNSSYGSNSGRSGAHTTSDSATSGYSRTKSYVTNHEEFREETGRTYYTLEEEWERVIARLMQLDRREAIIKVFNRHAIDIATPDVDTLPAVRPIKRIDGRGKKPSSSTAPPGESGSTGTLPEDFRE